MTHPCTVLWTSEPLVIGKHEWRVVVGDFPHLVALDRAMGQDDTNGRASFYEWRPLAYRGSPRDWQDERDWHTYDGDRSDNGTPHTLRKLWEREAVTIRALPSQRNEGHRSFRLSAMPAHDRVERLPIIAWNSCPRSAGIGAHHPVEHASGW